MKHTTLSTTLALAGAMFFVGCESKPTTTTTTSTTTTSSTTTGDDSKYKLYYAASMTGDPATITECQKKIGVTKADGMPADNMQKWMADYSAYVQKNAVELTKEIKDKDTAKAFYDKNK